MFSPHSPRTAPRPHSPRAAPPTAPKASRSRALPNEGLLNHVMPRMIITSFLEAHIIEQLARIPQHVRAAAKHHAIVLYRKRRNIKIRKELLGLNQVRNPAAIGKLLARDRRVINQLFLDQFAKVLVRRQVLGDEILVRKFIDETAGMGQHNL